MTNFKGPRKFKGPGIKAIVVASFAAAAIVTILSTPAAAYDSSNPGDPQNPASPNNPFNVNNPDNFFNPWNVASPLNPANQWRYNGYGWGYGYGYGAANPTIVGLAFWTGQPYTYWACQLGVDFQCPSSPNYAYHRAAAVPAADNGADAAPTHVRHRRKHRDRY